MTHSVQVPHNCFSLRLALCPRAHSCPRLQKCEVCGADSQLQDAVHEGLRHGNTLALKKKDKLINLSNPFLGKLKYN